MSSRKNEMRKIVHKSFWGNSLERRTKELGNNQREKQNQQKFYAVVRKQKQVCITWERSSRKWKIVEALSCSCQGETRDEMECSGRSNSLLQGAQWIDNNRREYIVYSYKWRWMSNSSGLKWPLKRREEKLPYPNPKIIIGIIFYLFIF